LVPEHVQQKIEVVADLRARSENAVGQEQRLIETITAKLGRPRTLWALLCVVVAWVSANVLVHVAGRPPFDPPPFFWLQGLVGLYAAIASTVVVTTQNRQNRHAEQRSYLELQVNLLAEQKTAKIIELLEELRRDMPAVRDRVDREAQNLSTAVNPKAVLSALERTMEDSRGVGRSAPLPPKKAPLPRRERVSASRSVHALARDHGVDRGRRFRRRRRGVGRLRLGLAVRLRA
jgi:uncharacterized membrane protein